MSVPSRFTDRADVRIRRRDSSRGHVSVGGVRQVGRRHELSPANTRSHWRNWSKDAQTALPDPNT
jgi:hypothetical protein